MLDDPDCCERGPALERRLRRTPATRIRVLLVRPRRLEVAVAVSGLMAFTCLASDREREAIHATKVHLRSRLPPSLIHPMTKKISASDVARRIG
jgi:hypothetical protein